MEPNPPLERRTNPSKSQARDQSGFADKWWVLLAIGIGTFMSALDGSVVNTILPVINASFASQVAAVEWVITVYLLVLSGLLLSFGRLGDMQGHKMVYLLGFAIFILSSALCGLAPSVTMLVLFRSIQAVGAAMLSANSPAILTKSFPASQRGQALGLQATMTYLGLTVGPSLGGWLTDALGWRAVFYINMPVGLLAFALSYRFIQADRPEKISEHFDLAGAALFVAGLVALLLGLNQGHALGWTSPLILSLLAGSLLLFTIFIRIERSTAYPVLDLGLFKFRLFSASTFSAVLNYICVYTIMFLMPFYLIQGKNLSAAAAGGILTAMPIVMAVVAPISGTLSDRFGTRLLTAAGMICLALGLLLLSKLNQSSQIWQIAQALGVAGLGIGMFISPNNSALMGSAPKNRQGIAAGIMATARNVGMVLGIGFSGAIFTTLLSQQGTSSAASLAHATQASFLVAAGIAVLGMIITLVRPERAEGK
ncbi:MAG: MFS transporter [Anaerolineales bacterium]|nr:MFS transporter [Anaerolineales bacterium]